MPVAGGWVGQLVDEREAPDLRLGEVQARERAQERVRDDHVDARLRVGVDEAAEPVRDGGVEVRDLDLDVEAVRPAALDVDLEVALVAARDEDALVDAPAD